MQSLPNHNSAYTCRLFALPSFVEGLSRLVDFSATLNVYNEDTTEDAADIKAMSSDWKAVGIDISSAIHAYEQLSPKGPPSSPRT